MSQEREVQETEEKKLKSTRQEEEAPASGLEGKTEEVKIGGLDLVGTNEEEAIDSANVGVVVEAAGQEEEVKVVEVASTAE